MKKIVQNRHWALIGIVVIGVFLRIFLFPNIPPGLNQDEAAAGYEAYSLLQTGKDKWGNNFPVYFSAWGSGQNVLYSYLSIPFIWLFGLNVFSIRIVNLVFGILTIPLLYFTVKQICGKSVAILATGLLAILPWHLMMSRWALESNLLPFFLLLGVYTVSNALKTCSSRLSIIICLIPWAISLYAYGTSFFIIPIFAVLVLVVYREIWWCRRITWLISLLLFLIISFPIVLFILKNFILNANLGFENKLSFSIPLLIANRRDQIAHNGLLNTLTDNVIFLLNGFQSNDIYNAEQRFPPLSLFIFPFSGVGVLVIIRHFLEKDRKNLFLLWLVSCIPLFFIGTLNINRANALFLPIIICSSIGFIEIIQSISDFYIKKITIFVTISWIVLSCFVFSFYYFFAYAKSSAKSFNYGLEKALVNVQKERTQSEKVLISGNIPLPYVYTLFYTRFPPQEFQNHSNYEIINKIYVVHNFDHFYFDLKALNVNSGDSFIYLFHIDESAPCVAPSIISKDKFWKIGRCIYP